VLQAMQDAETALSRYGNQRATVARLARASASAGKASMLTDQRNTAGTISTIDVLDVERQRLQAEQSLAQAQAEYTNDYVALQKSLGLGWGLPTERVALVQR
jgi:multidrug efflux system outer membrane protein